MKLRTLIIDDEPPARKKIRHFLEADSEIEVVGECENGHQALESIKTQKPDLLFLDIQMPHLDGLDLLKQIGRKPPCAVIFVTAYDQYAIDAFDVSATDYLLKPFTRKRFEEAVAKVKQQVSRQSESTYTDRIAIKSDTGIFLLACRHIDWIESEDNYVVIHAGQKSFLVRDSIRALESSLDPAHFVRIHRRILLNADRVQELFPRGTNFVILHNGTKLPVSRRLKQKAKSILFKSTS
jgi:two-component system, LytTR family, response regulator